ncbi:MAG: hypothetical protein WCT02_01815 [Candidatus Paceibacterota bacterium]
MARAILDINRTQPFDPQVFVRREWAIWRGPLAGDGLVGTPEEDLRAITLGRIDWNKVRFVNGLKGDEVSILGETKIQRIRKAHRVVIDALVGAELYRDYERLPKRSTLEWLRKNRGVDNLVVAGTTLRCPAGGRYVLYFSHNGSVWDWGGCWLGCRHGADSWTPVID